MCKPNPRRLTAEEREEEHYHQLYVEVEQGLHDEYIRDFGPTYRAAYPFKADGAKIHGIVERLMRSQWQD